MAKSDICETGLLDLLFLNTDFADIGDAPGLQNSAAAGSFYIALHTASPGEAGTELTANAKYRLTANHNQIVAPWDTLRLAIGSVGAPTAVSRISAWLYGHAVGA